MPASAKAGVSPDEGLTVGEVEQVQEQAYVVPKLYRRLMDYIAFNGGDRSLDGFEEISTSATTASSSSPRAGSPFDTVVESSGQAVKLTKPIEDLVFQEK